MPTSEDLNNNQSKTPNEVSNTNKDGNPGKSHALIPLITLPIDAPGKIPQLNSFGMSLMDLIRKDLVRQQLASIIQHEEYFNTGDTLKNWKNISSAHPHAHLFSGIIQVNNGKIILSIQIISVRSFESFWNKNYEIGQGKSELSISYKDLALVLSPDIKEVLIKIQEKISSSPLRPV